MHFARRLLRTPAATCTVAAFPFFWRARTGYSEAQNRIRQLGCQHRPNPEYAVYLFCSTFHIFWRGRVKSQGYPSSTHNMQSYPPTRSVSQYHCQRARPRSSIRSPLPNAGVSRPAASPSNRTRLPLSKSPPAMPKENVPEQHHLNAHCFTNRPRANFVI